MAEQTEKPFVIKAPWYSHWKPFLFGIALGGTGIGATTSTTAPAPAPTPVAVEKKCPVCVKEICKDVKVIIKYDGPIAPAVKINGEKAK